MQKLLSIGVVGGMGPSSTVNYLNLLITEFRKISFAKYNSDFPKITLCTIPESDHMVDSKNEAMIKELKNCMSIFEISECDFIVIVCNTAHNYINEYNHLPILKIYDSVRHLDGGEKENDSILVLGTRQTVLSGMYDEYFRSKKLDPQYLMELDQEKLDSLIIDANYGFITKNMQSQLIEIIRHYTFNRILLACTELSLFNLNNEIVIDSLKCLVKASYLVSTQEIKIS